MADVLHQLYRQRMYPAMSHPVADPAVSSVAAMLGGLDVVHPSGARVLEIGCGSGLNLVPLAQRWPDSRFLGVDLSGPAIRVARELAVAAGVGNVDFQVADLRDFQVPDGGFDFIIAHGFFSWVPDDVKMALLDLCGRHLAPSGIATISFNVTAGWRPRFAVVEKVRAIVAAGAESLVSALSLLRSVTEEGSAERAIVDDMLAKGEDILVFDDFGPVNDPWVFGDFVRVAAEHGLRCLGESDPGASLPRNIDPVVVGALRRDAADGVAFQDALDEVSGRTFRSCVLCRRDATVAPVSLERVFDLSVRAGSPPQEDEDLRIHQAIAAAHPHCVRLGDVEFTLSADGWNGLAKRIYNGIHHGWILPRIEPVIHDSGVPDFPKLDGFRLECARRSLPLVDIWHKPCAFPEPHYQVLAAMDGTRGRQSLKDWARFHCPDLVFDPWLAHLAERGMFRQPGFRGV